MHIVLGAMGTNGKEVVRQLRERHQPVRAIVRDRGNAADLSKWGAELFEADLAKPQTLAAAFAGGDTLFLLSPVSPNQIELELDALAAAREAKVHRIVKLSAIGANPLSASAFTRTHGTIEAVLRDSGLAWTIVRGAFFYSNLLFQQAAIKNGVYIGNWAHHPAAWVDPIDLAAVCVESLIDAKHIGQTYTVTGPAAFTNGELVQELSRGLSRQIHYVDQSPEEYVKTLVSHGSPEWVARADMNLRSIVVSGEAQLVTPTVKSVTGRSPRSMEQYIAAIKDALN